MSIRVTCTSCEAEFQVKDEFAGRKGACPECQAELVVPAGSASAEELEEPA